MGTEKIAGSDEMKLRGKRFGNHGISSSKLVTEPDHLYPGVLVDQVTDAMHGVGEVDKPGIGAFLLHVVDDLKDGIHVSCCMGKATRSAVFSVRLADAERKCALEIFLPKLLARLHFDR